MWNAFVSGIGFGFTLSLMVGPVFFGLIYSSIRSGFKAGLHYAFGVLISDILLVATALIIASFIDHNPWVRQTIIIFGSCAMCTLGAYYLFAKTKSVKIDAGETITLRRKSFFIKGLVLNLFTPTVLFFWVATSSFVTITYASKTWQILGFFVGCLATLFAMDMLKSYLALYIKPYLNDKSLSYLQKFLGLLLFGVGVYALFANMRLFR